MSDPFSFDLSSLGSSGFNFTGGGDPSGFSFQLPGSLPQISAPTSISGTFSDIASSIVGGAQTFYNAQAQIEQAKAQAAVAKAQGHNAVQVASAGLPSPQLLLFGGLGLMGVLLLTRKK